MWATLVLLSSAAHAFPACGIHSAALPRLRLARREPLLAMSGASGQESARGAAPAGEPKAPLARVLGWGMTCGALGVFLPIILRLVETRSAAGLSPLTWCLQLLGYALFVVYPARKGFPLSSYVEYAVLMAQSLAINCMIRLFAGIAGPSVAAGAAAYCAALALALRCTPLRLAKLCVPAATALLSTALLPQICRNFAARSSGGWSGITASLGIVGNSLRLYTTLRLAGGDRLLLAQFGLGVSLNAILLMQVLVWGA